MSDFKVVPFAGGSVGRPKKENDVKHFVKRPVGRPKKEKSEAVFDKKEYMRNYMKKYNKDNKNVQLYRRNTSYYVNKFNIPADYLDKYGVYTALMYKMTEDLKKIKNDCPVFLDDIKDIIKDLQEEDKKDIKE
jgi:hypothetical protein